MAGRRRAGGRAGHRGQAHSPTGLDHPRWLYVLPNGDVLVAETNAPPKPDDGKGIKGWFMKLFMAKAGAGAPSAESHHAAARRRRRRRRRRAHRVR